MAFATDSLFRCMDLWVTIIHFHILSSFQYAAEGGAGNYQNKERMRHFVRVRWNYAEFEN